MPNSNVEKPAKPTPDFPLFAHATRRWAKKIGGKLHYFGPWDDPEGALTLYNKQKDRLHAGKIPSPGRTNDFTRASANGKGGRQAGPRQPSKPSPDFPLFPHASGQWAKKIKGRLCYFGPWDDPDGALARYDEHKQELHSGRLKKVPRNSTQTSLRTRPNKPHKDFPLYAHGVGQWAKKIKGKTCYFGPWDDPQGALDTYLAQKDDLIAGRTPRDSTKDGCTVEELVNKFLASKEQLVESGELTQRSFDDYHRDCRKVVAVFGHHRLVEDLTPDDFERLRTELAKTLGPVSLGNTIARIRIPFKYAYDQYLIGKPVRYGQGFRRPSKAILRKERNKKGPRMFEAEQIRGVLDIASPTIKAMTLLGINCGFGNNDCATLRHDVLDLKKGWIDFPRPKTGIHRRCPLWPETVEALKDAIADMPAAKDEEDADLVFVTKYGMNWSDDRRRVPITHEFAKLLKRLNIKRPGLNFYALRHTFQTIGEQCRDHVAVMSIMGHAPTSNDMSSVYREEVNDDRLQAVTDHIRSWLFEG